MTTIDPSLYAGKALPLEPIDVANPLADARVIPEVKVVPTDELQDPKAPAAVRGAAVVEQASIPPSSRIESAKAAFQLSDTGRILRAFAHQDDDGEGPVLTPQEAAEFVANVDSVPSQDEREHLLGAKTLDGMKARWKRIQEIRELQRVSGDNFGTALAVYMVDPVQALAGYGIGKLSSLSKLNAARKTAIGAAAGAATPLAIEAVSVDTPRSEAELFMEMAASAVGTAMVARGGKFVPKDRDYPQAEVDNVLQTTKPHYRLAQREETVQEVIPAHIRWEEVSPAVYEDRVIPGAVQELPVTLDKSLKGAKPRFGFGSSNFRLIFSDEIDMASYIAAQSKKSKADSRYLQFVMDATGMSAEEVRAHGARVKATIKQQAATATGDALSVDRLYDGVRKTTTTVTKETTERVLVKKPVVRPVEVPEEVVTKVVKPAVWEEVPPALAPGKVHAEPAPVVEAVNTLTAKEPAYGWAGKLYWNIHKKMSKYSAKGKEVADFLLDNNSDLAQNSLESVRHGVLTDLRQGEFAALDAISAALKDRGVGVATRIFSPRKAAAVQDELMQQVQREMDRQMKLFRLGKEITSEGVDPQVWDIANKYNAVHKRALKELQAAGVKGSEALEYTPGFYSRKWSAAKLDDVIAKLSANGADGLQATKRLVAAGIRAANPNMSGEIAYDIGASIVNRVKRKGELQDIAFTVPAGEGQLKHMRDILKEEVALGNLSHGRMERALDILRQQSEDAGKAAFLKHRTVLDPETYVLVGGKRVQVSDMFDSRLETTVNQYLERVSTRVALARKGVDSAEALDKMRSSFIESVGHAERAEAGKLFDDIMGQFMGIPTGDAMNANMRLMQAYNRSITLGMSGVWQIAEASTMMGRYGMLKTMKHLISEAPGFRTLFSGMSKQDARSLRNVLTFHSEQHLRLKPYMHRYEDNFELPAGSSMHLSMQQINQLVPYANAMKFIQNNQARALSGLIMDRLEAAATGNTKARTILEGYGLKREVMDKIATEIKTHGWSVDNWEHSTWDAARPAFFKMMDEGVLMARLGDTPAFVQFDKVGKFIFTYRNFILAAHNKLMVGGLQRNGVAGIGLVAMYQMPLAALAVQTSSVLKGEGPLSLEDTIKKAGSQMSILGLFTEAYKVATGQMSAAGAPGLIAVDRGIQLSSAVMRGDAARTMSLAPSVVPLLSALPFARGLAKTFTED